MTLRKCVDAKQHRECQITGLKFRQDWFPSLKATYMLIFCYQHNIRMLAAS